MTTVVAGAGFGKSTSLAQAVRHNAVAPLGVDVWVTCGPGHENADELAAAILTELDGGPTLPGRATEMVLGALVASSPLDVCLIVDDCHLLTEGSSGERLLAELVRRLPANGHLVLAGRRLPDVPLARMQAAGSCVPVSAEELTFSEAEIAAVAELVDGDARRAAHTGGWPALVRLALVARPGVDHQFLREELLADLAPAVVRTLAALVVLGPSTDAEVRAVVDDPICLAELAERLPMIGSTGDEVWSAHQLWEHAALDAVPSAELDDVRRRAHGVLLARGHLNRAAELSIGERDWNGLGAVAVELLARSMVGLPADTVRHWLDAAPRDNPVAGLRLLAALARFMGDPRDPTAAGVADDVAAAARATGDVRLESVAIAVAALIAHGSADFCRLLPLARRAAELAAEVNDPILELLSCSLPAITADLAGDPDGVLVAFAPVPWGRLPAEVLTIAGHLRLQALWMAGRAAESVALADALHARTTDAHLRGVPWIARWFAGDPSGADEWRDVHEGRTVSARNVFVSSCLLSVVHACRGDTEAIDRLWSRMPVGSANDDARDSAHLTYARAAADICRHDETAAVEHYRRHLERFPVDVALGERHLRRWPALGYVLAPELRDHWDGVPLGPAHAVARRCAQALLGARDGRGPDGEPPTPAQLHTQLPLAWSAELAARWHALGRREGLQLATYLFDTVGPALRRELQCAAGDGATLMRLLPTRPTEPLEIRVLGSLQVLRGGVVVRDAALRRQRVRQLLTVLVVERTVRRERLLDVLWPDLGRDAASANLRVTLSHLRRILEPDREPGEPGSHLRSDAVTVELHESAFLTVDLWRSEEARHPRRAGGNGGAARAGARRGDRAVARRPARRSPRPRTLAGLRRARSAAVCRRSAEARRTARRRRGGGERPRLRRAGAGGRSLSRAGAPAVHRRTSPTRRPLRRDRGIRPARPRAGRARCRGRTRHGDPPPTGDPSLRPARHRLIVRPRATG